MSLFVLNTFSFLIKKKIYDYFFAALIESDAEGIGGSGFVECIREHINTVSGSWD